MEQKGKGPNSTVPNSGEITKVTAAIHNWLTGLDDAEYEQVMQAAQDRSWKRAYNGHGDKSAIEYYYRE